MHRLAEVGAYGVTFHDDDLIPAGSDAAAREGHLKRFRAALEETGLVVPMADEHVHAPRVQGGAFTNNDR